MPQRQREWGLRIAAALLLPFCASFPLAAQTVYRSVQDGVVTFSDQPPADAVDAQAIELAVPEIADDPQLEARLAAMRESTDRMAEDRRAREKHRAELRALRAPEPVATAPEMQTTLIYTGGYWPVAGRPIRPPLRPHPPLRPRPMPLPATAPPGWSVMKPGNAQLMRPVVSGRH
jgi:hypothetical protein